MIQEKSLSSIMVKINKYKNIINEKYVDPSSANKYLLFD